MSVIDQMEQKLLSLLNSIENRESMEMLIQNQRNFTKAVEIAMGAFQQGKIQVDVSQALPKVMYGWAVNELPIEIKNIEKLSSIKNQLILFQNTIETILRPREC
jgi:hypothetical protein